MEGGLHLCLKRDKQMVSDSRGEARKKSCLGSSTQESAMSLAFSLGFEKNATGVVQEARGFCPVYFKLIRLLTEWVLKGDQSSLRSQVCPAFGWALSLKLLEN